MEVLCLTNSIWCWFILFINLGLVHTYQTVSRVKKCLFLWPWKKNARNLGIKYALSCRLKHWTVALINRFHANVGCMKKKIRSQVFRTAQQQKEEYGYSQLCCIYTWATLKCSKYVETVNNKCSYCVANVSESVLTQNDPTKEPVWWSDERKFLKIFFFYILLFSACNCSLVRFRQRWQNVQTLCT